MEFIDTLHVKGEMSDADFQKEIDKEAERRKDNMRYYGRDGNVNVFTERREYRGIPYLIRIVRYYQIGVPLNEIKGMNNYGKWAVLEYPEEVKPLANLISRYESLTGIYEFLWQDTLHSGQEAWQLPQAIDWLDKQAHDDIDALYALKVTVTNTIHNLLDEYDQLLAAFNNNNKTEVNKNE